MLTHTRPRLLRILVCSAQAVVGQRVYTIVELDESLLSGAVLRRVVELYGMLYLDKYSQSAYHSC